MRKRSLLVINTGHVNPASVVGRKQEKTLQLLGLPAQEMHCPTPRKKRNRVQSSRLQGVSQGWTLKSVFRFFHSVSVGSPKIFAIFSCFLWTALFNRHLFHDHVKV
ncbi:hypothetical protein BRIN106911_08240 [Brevibacillus invocatus]